MDSHDDLLCERLAKFEHKYKTDFEVRYWNCLKKLKYKLRELYDCDEAVCPALRERRLRHVHTLFETVGTQISDLDQSKINDLNVKQMTPSQELLNRNNLSVRRVPSQEQLNRQSLALNKYPDTYTSPSSSPKEKPPMPSQEQLARHSVVLNNSPGTYHTSPSSPKAKPMTLSQELMNRKSLNKSQETPNDNLADIMINLSNTFDIKVEKGSHVNERDLGFDKDAFNNKTTAGQEFVNRNSLNIIDIPNNSSPSNNLQNKNSLHSIHKIHNLPNIINNLPQTSQTKVGRGSQVNEGDYYGKSDKDTYTSNITDESSMSRRISNIKGDKDSDNNKLLPLIEPNNNTIDNTEQTDMYNNNIDIIVHDWFKTLPVINNTKYSKDTKAKMDDLIKGIQDLNKESTNTTYTPKLEHLIKTFINSVSMWYGGADKNQNSYKNNFVNELICRINDINNNVLNGNHGINRVNTNILDTKAIVRRWIKMSGFKKCDEDKIVEILKLPVGTIAERTQVKRKIIDVIIQSDRDILSLHKKPYLRRCAYNLIQLLNYEKIRCSSFSKDICFVLSQNASTFHETLKEQSIFAKVDNFFETIATYDDKQVITDIILRNIENENADDARDFARIQIANVLMNNVNYLPVHLCLDLATDLIDNVYDTFADDAQNNEEDIIYVSYPVTKDVSVYTSHEIYPVTSTPKQRQEKEVQKFTKEELEYTENVKKLIRAWMETLPERFDAPNEKDFKEVIISDLAGDITDLVKKEQLIPGSIGDMDKYLQYIVYRWLTKLNVFEIEDVLEQLNDLVEKLQHILKPDLTKSQRGNRQAMDNLKFMESDRAWIEYYKPRADDILEDEISIWMNDLPSEIFVSKRTSNVHELAEALKPKLKEKRPENEIKDEVAKWLTKIVNDNKKNEVNELAEHLKDRLVGLPQDATLVARIYEKKKIKIELQNRKSELKACCAATSAPKIEDDDLEHTMKEFIVKYIDHNYDIDDNLARGAFGHLLKRELQRLSPSAQEQAYLCPAMAKKHERLSPDKLATELDNIKIISDWLKNMPVKSDFNTVGSKDRIEFVLDLAKTIQEIEGEKAANPNAMDFDKFLKSTLIRFLGYLPLTTDKNTSFVEYEIGHLMSKLEEHAKNKNVNATNKTMDTSGIHTDNIGDFIEEFIKINGNDIGDDEVKMEAWCVRLLREIKQMIRESPDPDAITKGQVYDRIADVPIPGDESIQVFVLELEYIKQIAEWIKNLPLLPLYGDEENRMVMITELAQKMAEKDKKPDTAENEKEFDDYVTSWIQRLPLDKNKEIVMSVLLQQLKKRMDKVKHKDESKGSQNSSQNDMMSQTSVSSKGQSSKESLRNAEKDIVEAIKKWTSSLPITTEDPAEAETIKSVVAKRLYQKVAEYNLDPQIANNDPLYQQMLSDEIDAIIDGLPQNEKLQSERQKLKADLVQTLVEGKTLIIEKTAGDTYKHKLENTIDASLPNPISPKKVYDPGFEIYKHRLAEMFILENFDHGDDDVKVKYERTIKHEIDKYFDNVKNKNAVALTNDEIYNELYSALFKVPIPNETSTAEEVEEIKTRCVIEAWFEDLPLKEADSLGELLEWDNILSTLAKRIHEIEKEDNPDEKIHKEIMKWLVKLPILPERVADNEMFAKKLEIDLKTSAKQRACVLKPKNDQGKTEKFKGKGKTTKPKSKTVDTEKVDPSNITLCWVAHDKPRRKAGDVVLELVKAWVDTVPILTGTPELNEQAESLRSNLVTKVILKISELSTNPIILNDDFMFNELLDQELDKQLSALPMCCRNENMLESAKRNLKDVLKSVIPLIKDEQAKSNYKQNLNRTIDNVLEKPEDLAVDKEKEFMALKNEIVDNFVQYHYDKDNEVGRQEYREKIDEAIMKFLTDIRNNTGEEVDPLIKRNQLMSQLAKIPIPTEQQLQEEMDEIRMKEELNEFFDHVGVKSDDKPVNQIKMSLAKKLVDIETTGHNKENDEKMTQEINKALKKVDTVCKPEEINKFIDKLKENEFLRKSKIRLSIGHSLECSNKTAAVHSPFKKPEKSILSTKPKTRTTGTQSDITKISKRPSVSFVINKSGAKKSKSHKKMSPKPVHKIIIFTPSSPSHHEIDFKDTKSYHPLSHLKTITSTPSAPPYEDVTSVNTKPQFKERAINRPNDNAECSASSARERSASEDIIGERKRHFEDINDFVDDDDDDDCVCEHKTPRCGRMRYCMAKKQCYRPMWGCYDPRWYGMRMGVPHPRCFV